MRIFSGLCLGLFLIGCAAPDKPPAAASRPPLQATRTGQLKAAPPQTPAPRALCAPLSIDVPPPDHAAVSAPQIPLVDLSDQEQMAPFYERLAQLARGTAQDHVRIGFYGDSNGTRDFITGELRRVLQGRFGDAGHGYIALGRPWSWYLHMDVRHNADKDAWKLYNESTIQLGDRLYGFGGIAVQSQGKGARTWVASAVEGAPVGTRISSVEIMYLQHPGYGRFSVELDRKAVGEVDTASEHISAGSKRFEFKDAPHRIDFIAGEKFVRLLGAILERKEPGVVVDDIAVGGVNSELIARSDRDLTVQTLRMRKHDLFVLLTGATEPDSAKHMAALREIVQRHQEARPGVPFVIMTPPDLAGGTLKAPTKSVRIGQIGKQKLKVAKELRTMFWDFRAAMGGEQSIVRFAENKMAWTDFIHLTEKGGRLKGARFATALLQDFQRYLTAHPAAGCRADAPAQ
ncbi:MAG TPA: hypothetical protein PKD61_00570 [Polyangiaceae bacterium]|nr:hypothetical protein [Polyangiaceae bacterium]